jgi:Holliday junction DNA helicase RuvA
MIRLLTGSVAFLTTDAVVVDVHGVGYEVLVPPHQLNTFTLNSSVCLHIYTHVREDTLQLFGFASGEERQFFVHLLSVSGVGPRTALNVMDKGLGPVVTALQQSDVTFFTHVPRLGKKTAQKIIVELQSKVGSLRDLDLRPLASWQTDVQQALLGMGYPAAAIADTINQVDASLPIDQALKWCIKQLSQSR